MVSLSIREFIAPVATLTMNPSISSAVLPHSWTSLHLRSVQFRNNEVESNYQLAYHYLVDAKDAESSDL
jgi:hypothetical protein